MSIACRAREYSGSPRATKRAPQRAACSSSRSASARVVVFEYQPAAAAGEVRQGVERLPGSAEAVDQRAERARPDALGADEAQPVESLRVGEARHPFRPIRLSVPATSRFRFSRCFHHKSAASATNSPAIGRWPSAQSTTGVAALATSADNDE